MGQDSGRYFPMDSPKGSLWTSQPESGPRRGSLMPLRDTHPSQQAGMRGKMGVPCSPPLGSPRLETPAPGLSGCLRSLRSAPVGARDGSGLQSPRVPVSESQVCRHHVGSRHCTNTGARHVPHPDIRGPLWVQAIGEPFTPSVDAGLSQSSGQGRGVIATSPLARDVPASSCSVSHQPELVVQLTKYLNPVEEKQRCDQTEAASGLQR